MRVILKGSTCHWSNQKKSSIKSLLCQNACSSKPSWLSILESYIVGWSSGYTELEDLGTANLRTRQCPQWYMAKNAVWLRCKLWKHKKSKSRLPYFPELSVHSLWTTALGTTEWKATYLKNFSNKCFKHIWQTSFRARELRSIICSGTKPQRPAVRTTKALGGKFQLH